MATSAVLRYNMNKITCYLDHARVAKCSASSGFNSVATPLPIEFRYCDCYQTNEKLPDYRTNIAIGLAALDFR